jgi:hypothetical protein
MVVGATRAAVRRGSTTNDIPRLTPGQNASLAKSYWFTAQAPDISPTGAGVTSAKRGRESTTVNGMQLNAPNFKKTFQ